MKGARFAALTAREGEHLLDQVPGALAGTLGPFQVAFQLEVVVFRRAFLGEHDVAHHAGEDIVEVMGDTAGEMADGLHLLGLAQLRLQLDTCLFRLLALGDVARECDEPVHPADGGTLQQHFVPVQAAVLVAAVPFQALRPAGPDLGDVLVRLLQGVRGLA